MPFRGFIGALAFFQRVFERTENVAVLPEVKRFSDRAIGLLDRGRFIAFPKKRALVPFWRDATNHVASNLKGRTDLFLLSRTIGKTMRRLSRQDAESFGMRRFGILKRRGTQAGASVWPPKCGASLGFGDSPSSITVTRSLDRSGQSGRIRPAVSVQSVIFNPDCLIDALSRLLRLAHRLSGF